MLSSLSSALSGLTTFGKQINVSAHNTANILTEGFKKSRVVAEELQPQGVKASIQTVDSPGPLIEVRSQDGPRMVELSNVDPVQEIVSQMVATRAYQANLNMIKTEDRLLGSILDIFE